MPLATITSESVFDVGSVPVNVRPAIPMLSAMLLHRRANELGGGAYTVGASSGAVNSASTPPATWAEAWPLVTFPVAMPGDDVGSWPGDRLWPGEDEEPASEESCVHAEEAIARAATATIASRFTRALFVRGPDCIKRPPIQSRPMLDRELAETILRAARARGGSFAELFVEERTSVSIVLDDGKIEELTSGLDRGAGVRVGHGTSFGYAFSNRLDRDALLDVAAAAAASLSEGPAGAVADLRAPSPPVVHRAERPAELVPAADKVAWLREVDDLARAFSPSVRQVSSSYGDSVQRVLIATSDGRWVEETRPRIRLGVQVVAGRDGVIQTGFHGPAGLAGVEFFDAHPLRETTEVAARRAVTMLDSGPAPAGEMAVVLAPGMGGVLFHEACGHPLEADIVDKEASVYRGRIGERLASSLVTGVDDATIPNAWGSFSFDDEGAPAQRTTLFEDGMLRGWMYDRLRAEKDGVASSGNGRRQSYAHPPIPRMTNSYILNGTSKAQDLVSSTERGVYVTALGGGQTNPATGDFVFGVSEGYLIEGGKVTTPVRGANLIGRAIEVMSAVDAVADDFDTWEGVCGKEGQGVPVGSGSPTLRIARITVGGTGA